MTKYVYTLYDRYLQVLYAYTPRADNEMKLEADEIISLLTVSSESGWWEGVVSVGGVVRTGWFPAAYVKQLDDADASPSSPSTAAATTHVNTTTDGGAASDHGGVSMSAAPSSATNDHEAAPATAPALATTPAAAQRRHESMYVDTDDDEEVDAAADIPSPLPNTPEEEQARKLQRTIEEIVQTERDYVNKLFLMGKGYVTPMRPLVGELFDEGSIGTLFGNIEQLLQGQASFLEQLEAASASGKDPGRVAQAFIDAQPLFRMYSPYCNNHPRAVETLEGMVASDDRIWSFFEGCRMMLDDELSVSALMIKPVQRICQ